MEGVGSCDFFHSEKLHTCKLRGEVGLALPAPKRDLHSLRNVSLAR